jgi:hypothetical protein
VSLDFIVAMLYKPVLKRRRVDKDGVATSYIDWKKNEYTRTSCVHLIMGSATSAYIALLEKFGIDNGG